MFIVLGATGHVGSAVSHELLDLGHSVTAVVRDEAKAEVLRKRGAQIAVADVNDVDRLREIFRTGKRAFLLNPPAAPSSDTDRDEQITRQSILAALQESILEKVVLQSTYGAQPGSRIGDFSVLYEFEQALSRQSIPAEILRAAYYMSNWDLLLPVVRNGPLPTMYPADLRIPMVAPLDLGRAAARLLQRPLHGHGEIHFVEGPTRYCLNDVVAAFSRALGKSVELQVIPRKQWEVSFREQGFSPEAASTYARMTAVSVDGGFEMPDNPERGQISLQDYVSELVAGSV